MDQSLRKAIAILEDLGEIHYVDRPVDPLYEIGAVMSLKSRGPSQVFSNVRGYSMPVAGNLFNSRAKIALGMGVAPERLQEACLQAINEGIAPEMTEEAPVQECFFESPLDLKRMLPVPTWFEQELGPYITAGIIVAKDPETGRRNVSIARLRLEGGDALLAGISPSHHLSRLMEKAQARGEELPIAVVIGNHPAVLLASQMYVELGHDEFDIAGALLEEPLRLTRCRTVDLEVPAEAEIVLEGVLYPGDLKDEGPVSEFHGFYEHYGPGQAVRIRAVTHRKDPIFQTILPGFAPEHLLLGGVAIGATTCNALRKVIPSVRRVLVTEGGMGRVHAVITLKEPRAGEGKRAILLAMAHTNLLKFVIAVDDEIDPEDPIQVAWALAARMQGDRDVFILPGMKADRCDPMERDLMITKVGIDATTAPGERGPEAKYQPVHPPREVLEAVRKDLDLY